MKFGCLICIFLNSANLICRSTDISKCFRGSLQVRDNETRLYSQTCNLSMQYYTPCFSAIFFFQRETISRQLGFPVRRTPSLTRPVYIQDSSPDRSMLITQLKRKYLIWMETDMTTTIFLYFHTRQYIRITPKILKN